MSQTPGYPQRRLFRSIMRLLGRMLLPLLAVVEVQGLERFPREGPLIVVGNHTGALEVVLLTVYAPRIVEYLGSVDIPHEGYIASFIDAYGFIPVFRGKASRSSMEAGLDVLRQAAVLGLFPEGGIWEPAIRRAQAGVAWLSFRGKAPVLPVGFSSTRGALGELLRFKRPRLTMHIGDLIPAIELQPGTPRKRQLKEAADDIVDAIWDLVPGDDREPAITDESFGFMIELSDSTGKAVPVPGPLRMMHGPSLSKFLHRTSLFNNLLHNLRLPVGSLNTLHTHPPLEELLAATDSILSYLRDENPYYFTYRYGPHEGGAMEAGIQEFFNLIAWAIDQGHTLRGLPIRQYRRTDTGVMVKLTIPQEEDKW